MQDNYFSRPEVSNSDLSNLDKYFKDSDFIKDAYEAYRFGTLIDLYITEPERVDHFKLTAGGYTYNQDEFQKAKEMKREFMKHEMAASLMKSSTFQKVMSGSVKLQFDGIDFELLMRCKFDGFVNTWGWDLKSTTATTQKQFVEACYHFDYDRQRAVYMELAGSNQDYIIGISKVNHKVFHLPIKRGDEFHKSGMNKLNEIGFKYWSLFGDVKVMEGVEG